MEKLTHKRLLEVIKYDKESGCFYRLIATSNVPAGKISPRPAKNGYLRMHVDGKLYYLHRLAWFYMTGEWPITVDHKDGDRQNNKLENLRSVPHHENCQNWPYGARNKSGFMGVYYNEQIRKYQAKISVNGKSKNLGYFKTPEEAHEAYLEGKKKYHTFCPEFIR